MISSFTAAPAAQLGACNGVQRSAGPVPACRQKLGARAPRRSARGSQYVCAALVSGEQPGDSRRQFLKLGSGALLSSLVFERPAWAEDASGAAAGAAAGGAAAPAPAAAPQPKAAPGEYKQVVDETLAYSFKYPVATGGGRKLSWVPTRGPLAYSNAAPLSPDARQRIVFEVVNLKGPLTTTVTVGPPPPVLETVGTPETWTPKQIAVAVLADRSTGRITSGQRISLAKVESARKKSVDGLDYVYWDSVTRGSPNFADSEAETYRRAIGVTVFRDGYFYTFSTSANDVVWEEVEPVFLESVKSFRLDKPGKKFLKPAEEGLGLFGL